jgi:hypothetical protein
MGWRRITNATNERTGIFSVMPLAGAGDSIFLADLNAEPKLCAAFLGCLNSLVADYVARQKIGGTNFSFYYIRKCPSSHRQRMARRI